jgi:hypothetical protein
VGGQEFQTKTRLFQAKVGMANKMGKPLIMIVLVVVVVVSLKLEFFVCLKFLVRGFEVDQET